MKTEALCIECGCRVPYVTEIQPVTFTTKEIKGAIFRYDECVAKCSVCNDEVFVPEIHDKNVAARLAIIEAAMKGEEKT